MNCSAPHALRTACPIKKTRGRPPKSHDNALVREWLSCYSDPRDFCRENTRAEDVLYACAHARGPRDTGRGLHSFKLFAILQSLEAITSSGVAQVLGCAERTAQVYALSAEIASRAITPMAVLGLESENVDLEVHAVPNVYACDQDF